MKDSRHSWARATSWEKQLFHQRRSAPSKPCDMQENGPKLETRVCVRTGKAILESQTQLSGGKPHLWAWLLTGWTAGEVVLWEGRQGSWHFQLKPGALFSINIMCQETPECKLPPIVARGWIWREGALLQTGVRLLPQDSSLLNPEVPEKHQSWRQKKKKMCTVTSKVKEKIPFSKTT